ncbi:MAG: hypothetical protein AAGD07_08270 [Planctomycetota bacterium]
MFQRNLPTICLVLSLQCWLSASAEACWLTDWLYGRRQAVPITGSVPYAAGYAPYGYVPGNVLQPAPTYAAGYTPLLTQPAALPTTGTWSTRDNPSVYTGRPVLPPTVTGYRGLPSVVGVPVANGTPAPALSGYRGLATTGGDFYGTGNVYPNDASAPYAAGYAPSPVVNPVVAPEPRFATPIRSGLARFFGALWGTNYRSSYYSAPITYYRPVNQIDPVTGTTVTIQQGCQSTVQQLQRTPLTSWSAANNGVLPASGAACGTGAGCSTIAPVSGYSQLATPSTTIDPLGGGVTTIPSTIPSVGGQPIYGGSVSQPLTGGSTWAPTGSGVAPATDLQPVRPPTLSPNAAQPSALQPSPLVGGSQSQRLDLSQDRNSPYGDQAFGYGNGANLEPSYSQGLDDSSLQTLGRDTGGADAGIGLEAPENGSGVYRSPYEDPQSLRDLTSPFDPSSTRQNSVRNSADRLTQYTTPMSRQTGPGRDDETPPHPAWSSVKPIPAPRGYRSAFEAANVDSVPAPSRSAPHDSAFRAPSLLPALPRPDAMPYRFDAAAEPAATFQAPSASQSIRVPVREASVLGDRDRLPRQSPPREPVRPSQPEPQRPVRESGWYSLGK